MRGEPSLSALPFMLALPIFPVRLQTSIFGASELNFRVRDGNGWTLTAINTNLHFLERKRDQAPGFLRIFQSLVFDVICLFGWFGSGSGESAHTYSPPTHPRNTG